MQLIWLFWSFVHSPDTSYQNFRASPDDSPPSSILQEDGEEYISLTSLVRPSVSQDVIELRMELNNAKRLNSQMQNHILNLLEDNQKLEENKGNNETGLDWQILKDRYTLERSR